MTPNRKIAPRRPLLTRRTVLGAGAALAAGAGAYLVLDGGITGALRARIARVFGPDYADHPDTGRFVQDFVAALAAEDPGRFRKIAAYYRLRPSLAGPLGAADARLMDEVVTRFAQSTNVVQAEAGAAEFEYVLLFDPIATPCSNQLAAHWV